MDTYIDLKCPVPATTLWPSGTHWTRGVSPNQVKGPLIAKRKNEGVKSIFITNRKLIIEGFEYFDL